MTRTATLFLSALFLITACENSAQSPVAQEATASDLRDVTPAQAAELLQNNEEAIVLDVRSPQEFASGHIDGALNVTFGESDFETNLAALDKEATYVLTCESGRRSKKTLSTLAKLGFVDVAHLKNGMASWRRDGLPIAGPK